MTSDIQEIESKRVSLYKKLPREEFPGYIYIGSGKISNELCGTYWNEKSVDQSAGYMCECGESYHLKANSCKKLSCPVCYLNASSDRAKRIAERMMYGHKKFKGNLFHISLNPRDSQMWIVLSNIDKFKKQVIYPFLKRNFISGVVMFHLYRIRNDKLVISPHWHIIGHSPFKLPFVKNKRVTAKGVFSLKNYRNMRVLRSIKIRNWKKFRPKRARKKPKKLGYSFFIKVHKGKVTKSLYMRFYDRIFSVARYQLSHASGKNYSTMYSYYGKFANCRFKVDKDLVNWNEVPVECEKCGSKLYEIEEFQIEDFSYSPFVQKRLDVLYRNLKKFDIMGTRTWRYWKIKGEIDRYERYKILHRVKVIKLNKKLWLKKEVISGFAFG